jgi:hypothetical protein
MVSHDRGFWHIEVLAVTNRASYLSPLIEIKIERGESCLRKQKTLSFWALDMPG